MFLLFQIVDIGSSTYKSQVSSTFKDSAKGHTTQILIPTVAFDYKFVGSSGYETSVKPEQIENLTGFKKNLDSSIRELKSLLLRHYSLVEVLTYGIKNHDYESDDNQYFYCFIFYALLKIEFIFAPWKNVNNFKQ